MVALLQESGDDEVTTPPTIQALLAARLDQLDPRERSVLQCGAVEGRTFHQGALRALIPEETDADSPPDGARAQGADSPGDRRLPFRGSLSLPPSVEPGRCLRRIAEGHPGRAPRTLRDLARRAPGRARRARRAARVSPRAGRAVQRRAGPARRRAGRARPRRGSGRPAFVHSIGATWSARSTCSAVRRRCCQRPTMPGSSSSWSSARPCRKQGGSPRQSRFSSRRLSTPLAATTRSCALRPQLALASVRFQTRGEREHPIIRRELELAGARLRGGGRSP